MANILDQIDPENAYEVFCKDPGCINLWTIKQIKSCFAFNQEDPSWIKGNRDFLLSRLEDKITDAQDRLDYDERKRQDSSEEESPIRAPFNRRVNLLAVNSDFLEPLVASEVEGIMHYNCISYNHIRTKKSSSRLAQLKSLLFYNVFVGLQLIVNAGNSMQVLETLACSFEFFKLITIHTTFNFDFLIRNVLLL